MKNLARLALTITALLTVALSANADMVSPTGTNVYFSIENVPYNSNVEYTIDCYGYTYSFDSWEEKEPGTYTPEVVYSYSASCPEYGCTIYEPYYLNYRNLDYCNLTANTQDGEYFLEKFASTPVPTCEYISQYDIYTGENYYRLTGEYDTCIDQGGSYSDCENYKEVVPESELLVDNNGYALERMCELSVDLVNDSNKTAGFSDVDIENSYFDAIAYVKDEGIVNGYSDGTYRPSSKINRAEFTKILIESVFSDSEINSCTSGKTFSDVPSGEWFSKYVCTASKNSIIDGYPDGSFKPEGNINFAEAAKILVNSFNFETQNVPGSEWYAPFVNVIEDESAIPVSVKGYSYNITRGEMAEMIYRLRENITDRYSVIPSLDWIY
ncbi:MAG: S-layer homology domain-containing protein [Candidatus Peregrinibacteria bacterium]